MRVQLLGTGSADGWPNAFCGCASCLQAHRTGRLRSPTSVLVDDRLLLDCGPETPRAALRHADGLRALTHILITHDHPDHSAPMALLARSWAGRREPVTVVGPAPVLAAWQQWTGPHDPVRWVQVSPGDELDLGSHTVRALAAAHGAVPAVVYDVTASDGARLLYATDTGPLPEQTVAGAADAGYDLLLLEATFGDRSGPGRPTGIDHLDLQTFAEQLVRLRDVGALVDHSQVAAVHLSHHSPPDLGARLAGWGVRLVDDGHRFDLPGHRPATLPSPEQTVPQRTPPHRTLVLGGARSGKSTAAERLLAAERAVTYVATGAVPDGSDGEWTARVERHRQSRPQHWTTIETTDLATAVRESTTPLLVDCLGTWLTSMMDRVGAWQDTPGWQDALVAECDALLEAWHDAPHPVVAVSNEVGSGVVPATAAGRTFRDHLGRLNARVSAASERVLLVVAGRTVDLSGPHSTDDAPPGAPAVP